MYRLVDNSSAGHFYTTSATERSAAVAQYGYQSENVAFYAFTSFDTVLLYRLTNGHQWYTIDLTECYNAITQLGQHAEDVACFVAASQASGTSPFYRLLNPLDSARFYTTSADERDAAITDLGYQLEGISGYLYTDQASATVPLFRLLKTDLCS